MSGKTLTEVLREMFAEARGKKKSKPSKSL